MSPAKSLRARMAESGLVHIMAAHSPFSAILAEEAGFDGLWASGFELSALYGLPDMSLISMTQYLDMLRAIAGRTRLPIVADIDTNYGSAVVIEDKTFPKVTSLVADGRQHLLRVEEFQGKIEAAIKARSDPDFLVIARTEALIASLGEAEALHRAHAYAEVGADMILIHSKRANPSEIESFSRAWTRAVPLVIVPNAYPDRKRSSAALLIGACVYFDRSLRGRGFQIADNALTAASIAFRSITLGSNCSGPQRRIFSCSG
ncbi:isocitrate lyase/phosphoenolpyruvate mutase family protein [Bradyrhizobium sp. 143]|uniref:isocitrate lyase/phosphoenolpyruvate mutase family protein n=1 Tax=Bradyrhizobium sp. 143 TaxID=2782619 RepID=UPI001FFB6F38|nr:isocitrate lyase/phosphoenolpyruvate mutase family protein [Bradyrhizobium sp. 143]MCK1707854.1 isocitrate lyase/phosphoenolpyruvate mutase family protein [Bradyrhizobium sp. 143]